MDLRVLEVGDVSVAAYAGKLFARRAWMLIASIAVRSGFDGSRRMPRRLRKRQPGLQVPQI